MIARIYTENLDQIVNWVKEHIPNCTVFTAIGFWQGNQERSLILELVGDFSEDFIIDIAKTIKLIGNQAAVLITILRDDVSKLV